MSMKRTIARKMNRDLEAIELALLAKTEPKTGNSRMALAGNTGSSMRRQAAQAIAKARLVFKPEPQEKVIEHRPLPHELAGYTQLIQGFTKFKAPKIHNIALYIAQRAKSARTSKGTP